MIRIGNLQVDFQLREIRREGTPLKVGSRALDILETLITANGALVSKDEIMRRVWPRTIVEETNLTVHIAALRKLLVEDRGLIRTVPGRGYQLVPPPDGANDRCGQHESGLGTTELTVAPKTDPPAHFPGGELIGRETALEEISALIGGFRSVTLVGTGGIGKTRLALAVAKSTAQLFSDGTVFVALARVADEQFALEALACALSLDVSDTTLSIGRIAHSVRGKRILIVFDNCEHLVEASARFALELQDAGCVILATSREALRIPGEVVYSVPPLEVPTLENGHEQIGSTGAVRLFITRLRVVEPELCADERKLHTVARICHALDGIPLAIELAASRAAVLGIDVLCEHLGDRLRILSGGYRSAMPKHQTMRATLDWSYLLLNEVEQAVLRRLGVFVGGFTFDAIVRLDVANAYSTDQIVDAFAGLVSKSMVVVDLERSWRRYRLLETTREYALEKLDENGEYSVAANAHARYFLERFTTALVPSDHRSCASPLSCFAADLDNVRAALDWAFSSQGKPALGIALFIAVSRYFLDLSLAGEYRHRANQALSACERDDLHDICPEIKLKLRTALATDVVDVKMPPSLAPDAWSGSGTERMSNGTI